MWSVPNVNHVSGTDPLILARPAGIEPATYALEEFVAVQKINKFNNLSQKNFNCATNCAVGFDRLTDILKHPFKVKVTSFSPWDIYTGAALEIRTVQ